MKTNRLIVMAFIVATGFVACSPATEKVPTSSNVTKQADIQPGEQSMLPSFVVHDINGNTLNLQSLKGKKVFVNLWATWCPPCRAEMPSIEKLYASVDTNKAAFVMLSYDDNPDDARQYKRANRFSLPVYFPAEQPPALFQTEGIPATFIFNEQGNLVKQNMGAAEYDTDAYRSLLQ